MMYDCDVGEFLICDVVKEGIMEGLNLLFVIDLIFKIEKLVIYVGGVLKFVDCVDFI